MQASKRLPLFIPLGDMTAICFILSKYSKSSHKVAAEKSHFIKEKDVVMFN